MDGGTLPRGRRVDAIKKSKLENTLPPGRLVTKIHNKWYDLTDFEKLHPGGPVSLGLAAGRDGTVLFESHHPFTNRKSLNALLAAYELSETQSKDYRTLEEQHGIPEHPFQWDSEFGKAVKFHVKQYFETEAKRRGISVREATKATPARWMEIFVMTAALGHCLQPFLRGEWAYLFLLPTVVWFLAMAVFHDATHFALHLDWRVNALLPYILWPNLVSPFTWYHQHNIGHHSYPNIGERDPDLLHRYWTLREHKSVEWVPSHNKQRNLGFLLLWWAVALEFVMSSAEEVPVIMDNLYNETVPIRLVSKTRIVVHFLGRVLTFLVVYGWPFFKLDSWVRAFAFSVGPFMFFSFLFMLNTQINHLAPTTAHAEDSDWYKHQVITAQDFGVMSKFCFYFSGGLNYQSVHHLFPTVNHCHLPKLQSIVAKLCEKYSIDYQPVAGYIPAIRAHLAHTVNMSRRDGDDDVH